MISVVVCSREMRRFERVSKSYRRAFTSERLEIIGIHDATGLAEGYNRGLARSTGDIVIFSHDDIEILPDNFEIRLQTHLRKFDLLGIAGATKLQTGQWIMAGPPHVYGQVATPNRTQRAYEVTIWNNAFRSFSGIKALDGVFLCARRHVAESVRFDQETFRGFHLYDIDFSFRAYQAGFSLAVCSDLQLLHESFGNFDERFESDQEKFVQKHAAALDQGPQRLFTITTVRVEHPAEVLDVMTPTHWPPAL
jgi:GT2 family glycosyltransferase